MPTAADSRLAGRVAFTYPEFTVYEIARFLIVTAMEMQSVAVGWQVYEITHRALDLGLVGLAQFLPGLVLFLPAGHAADRVDRRQLLIFCYIGFALSSALLLGIAWRAPHSVNSIYFTLVLIGIIRSFSGPVSRAILPQLVPEEHFQNAVAWNSSIFMTATILGPALGGVVYAFFHGPSAVYVVSVIISIVSIIASLRIRPHPRTAPPQEVSLGTVLAGLDYIWKQKLILGSISLDMFAVLLGGAVALLPIFAKEILHTGPWGLGLLRSAPGVGAASMAIVVAHWPLKRNVGATMLWCVAGFGVFTVLFGLSHSFILSLIALFLTGACDMISVIVRGTLVQLATPDDMRGRVNAVDMIFIGVSNELGQFESGLTAAWFGAVRAVILGGIGTLAVIATWAWLFPELRKADRMLSAKP